jgi:general secretion pathway protein L
MSTLIFKLPQGMPTSTAALRVVQVGSNTAEMPRHFETSLASLAQVSGTECVALVPPSRLSWLRIELPAGTLDKRFFQDGGSARLRSVLDGLLEERVLDDTAQLHFALAPDAQTGVPVWVAVCDRAWLQAWLMALEQSGRAVSRIVPEFAPTDPNTGTQVYALGESSRPLVVCCGAAGVTSLPLSASTLQWLLPLDPQSPAAQWHSEPGVAQLAEQLSGAPVPLQTESERAAIALQSSWDLAQFDFSASRQARSRKRWSSAWDNLLRAPQWRAARWSAVAVVAAQVVGLQAWSWKDQADQAAKRNAIASVLTATFPETKVIIDAPVQMARSVAALQRQSGAPTGSDMESLLSQFGTLAPETTAPAAIEFAANELRIGGLDSNAAEFSSIAANLQTQGLRARWEGTTLVVQSAPTGAKP